MFSVTTPLLHHFPSTPHPNVYTLRLQLPSTSSQLPGAEGYLTMKLAVAFLLAVILLFSSSLQLVTSLVSSSLTPSDVQPPPPPPPRLTLNDRPIVGDSHTSLDGEWLLTSPALPSPITGRVPGDLISDLFHASLLPEPLFENNFLVNASLWNNNTFTYTTNLTLSAAQMALLSSPGAGDVWLVFDGIKMGANITVNGVQVGQSRAQFLRLNFSLAAIASSLHEGANTLQVIFDPHISVHGLFMQCTGGWDWAPVSQSTTLDSDRLGTYSRGIWKSVYLVTFTSVAVTDMTVHTIYLGPHPTTPLLPHQHRPFDLTTTVHLFAPSALSYTLTLHGEWQEKPLTVSTVSVQKGVSSLTLTVEVLASDIDLWWPNGFGDPTLYRVSVNISTANSTLLSARRVGFRVFAIVTGNDTDPNWVKDNAEANGSVQMGLRYRINGEPIFSRGANMIPMDELEGRYSAEAHARVVLSARDGRMNILRVWAGGIWLPDVFYDTADEVGIMIYHDMVNRWNYNARYEETLAYQHQIRRVSSHPALVVYSGCNECFPLQGGGIVPQLLILVSGEDYSRPIWPACPAQGFTSGVNRLTGLPNGQPLAMYSDNQWGPMDTHGPYQHGDGFPAVNGDNHNLNLFDPMTPPHFNRSLPIGLQYNHTFTSEFGSVGWSSFESMSTVFAPEHWSVHGGTPPDNCTNGVCVGGNVVAQRNYPADSLILTYFGGKQAALDAVGESAFKEQLYKCLMAQALVIKGYIEQHRATNTFGLMLWQLDEIWPTGGWGTVEYGGQYPGQVVGGRWKPAHHWLVQHLYEDVIISCGLPIRTDPSGFLLCYVKLDAYRGAGNMTAVIDVVQLADSTQRTTHTVPIHLSAGPGSIQWFNLDGLLVNASAVALLSVRGPNKAVVSRNFFISTTPSALALPHVDASALTAKVGEAGPDGSVPIHITKSTPAVVMWLVLTTLAAGRFSENVLIMTEDAVTVAFHPWGPLNHTHLVSSLRMEHLNQYATTSQQHQVDVTVD